jgi:pyrroline-5-carboxylate reductase
MACALGGGIASDSGNSFSVIASDPSPEAGERFRSETGGRIVADIGELAEQADVVILAVKPQVLPDILPQIRSSNADKLVVSIAAGISLRQMQSALGDRARIIRAMPNTPSLIRRGMTVLAPGPTASERDLDLARQLFSTAGRVLDVADEGLLDAVTAVSGSGPGFLFAYAEGMIEAGVRAGLPLDMTKVLVQETIAGAAELWRSSDRGAGDLRRQVTSPGGTTEAGLAALTQADLAGAIDAAIQAATRRSQELSGS